jgi:hypothetical protein
VALSEKSLCAMVLNAAEALEPRYTEVLCDVALSWESPPASGVTTQKAKPLLFVTPLHCWSPRVKVTLTLATGSMGVTETSVSEAANVTA